MTIFVCGEGLVDLVPTAVAGHDGPLLAPRLGGGPFNVAVALGRLGSDVEFFSRLSTDAFGRELVANLHAAGVRTSILQRGSEPTTLALTSLDPAGAAAYSFYAGGTADRLVTAPTEVPGDLIAASFGTLSLLYEPGATVYSDLLADLHGRGVTTVLDPNVRPAAIDDPTAYRARFHSWLPSVDILKVSVDDAQWLVSASDGSAVDDAAFAWIEAGVTAVVVTRGGDGISVVTDALRVDVEAPAVTVADTIGAGDTVHAALLHHLSLDGSLDRTQLAGCTADRWRGALEFAGRAAAITVSRPGADPPWASELEGD